MFKRDWSMFSHVNNCSTLNNEHNWEDLCIYLRNHQRALSITITKLGEVQFSIQSLQMFHFRFAIAIRALL